MDMKAWLSFPFIYKLFAWTVGEKKCRTIYARDYIQSKGGETILDIGCGPADIIKYLPPVDYWGFDSSQKYIDSAIRTFGKHGKFFCASVGKKNIDTLPAFDIVLANGVLHHLNDKEALALFELARTVLKPGGRLITLDNCYGEGQSRIAKWIVSQDRGHFVRSQSEYAELANKVFKDCLISIRHDLLHIPYTHIILECSK